MMRDGETRLWWKKERKRGKEPGRDLKGCGQDGCQEVTTIGLGSCCRVLGGSLPQQVGCCVVKSTGLSFTGPARARSSNSALQRRANDTTDTVLVMRPCT
jgi:hypothetical protein